MSEETAEAPRTDALRSLVLRTALVSVAVAVAVIALAAALVGSFAPRLYMDMYRSLGAYGMSSAYAEAALRRAEPTSGCTDGDCGYITLASGAVEVASVALSDSGGETHAARLYDFTCAYLSADCHDEHSRAMDEYYSEVYASSPESLCAVYGYDAYVCGERVRAMRYISDRAYDGGLGEVADGCATFGEAMDAYAVSLASSDALLGEDMFVALECLTAYASDNSDVSAIADAGLRATYSALSLAAEGMEDGMPKAYLQYKLYRLAFAFGSADGGEEWTDEWTADVTAAARSAYSETIRSIKNV